MGSVVLLFGFGIGFIFGGAVWKLFDDIINSYISRYVFNATDPYYVASDLIWDVLPFIIIGIGVICLIIGALSGRTTRTVVME